MEKIYRYFGHLFDNTQEFIDCIYEMELSIVYKKAEYDIWLDGNGYCIGMTSFGVSNVTHEQHMASIKAYETPEELIEDYTFYDGVKLKDAMLMDYRKIRE